MGAAVSVGFASCHNSAVARIAEHFPDYRSFLCSSLEDIIHHFENFRATNFSNLPYVPQRLSALLRNHNITFKPFHNLETDYGTILKKDLSNPSEIVVKADFHANLKSTLAFFHNLQKENKLNAHYKCVGNLEIVILGDFTGRGAHSLAVLELLIALKLENPNQVTLIRGNHEDFRFIAVDTDLHFKAFLQDVNHQRMLSDFYESLPLSLYLSQAPQSGARQYVQFTHGLFELYLDPFPLFESTDPFVAMAVPKNHDLSPRVLQLVVPDTNPYLEELKQTQNQDKRQDLKMRIAAKRIAELCAFDSRRSLVYTTYNWGDLTTEHTYLGNPENRKWRLCIKDMVYYWNLFPHSRVKMLFRGHSHQAAYHIYQDRIIATTLPGIFLPETDPKFLQQRDLFYVLQTAPSVSDWKKRASVRDLATDELNIMTNVGIGEPDR